MARQRRATQLLKALKGQRRLLVLTHENPDPDAIASGSGLAHLVTEQLGIEAALAYGGIIGRAENKAMVDVLGIEMVEFSPEQIAADTAVAVVDAQPEAGNLPLPPEVVPLIVIDHHPLTTILTQVPFADVRPRYGATSTIVAEYLIELRLPIPPDLATALYYGIKTDTQGLSRHTCDADRSVYFHLLRLIDEEALPRIEYPRLPRQYFETFRTAMERAFVYGDVIISGLDEMDNPNAVAEVADLLLRLEGMKWALSTGFFGDHLFVSLRTSDPDLNAGEVVQKIMLGLGSSGGHGVMAGGKARIRGKGISARRRLQADVESRFLTVLAARRDPTEKLLSLKPRRSKTAKLA